jgi:hypothetical protein
MFSFHLPKAGLTYFWDQCKNDVVALPTRCSELKFRYDNVRIYVQNFFDTKLGMHLPCNPYPQNGVPRCSVTHCVNLKPALQPLLGLSNVSFPSYFQIIIM